AILLFRLTHIGWREVVGALPASPWFFAFFLLHYLALPVTETAAYEIIWRRPLLRRLPAFLRKRVYNYAVAGYSGEGFLALWARRRLGLSDREALVGVKDNNVLSSFTANVATVGVVLALAAAGGLDEGLRLLPGAAALFAASFLAAAAMATIVALFRKRLVALSAPEMRQVIALHAARQAMTLTLFAAMYAAAIPSESFGVWFWFIGLQLVLSRIPFLPNQDLVYLTVALSFAALVGAPREAVAGMLVAEAGLSLLFSVTLFVATLPLARRTGAREPLKAAGAGGLA
ncbi:MAG: hypothetical protein AB7P23_09585, partial [Amphiplicatus sp.]